MRNASRRCALGVVGAQRLCHFNLNNYLNLNNFLEEKAVSERILNLFLLKASSCTWQCFLFRMQWRYVKDCRNVAGTCVVQDLAALPEKVVENPDQDLEIGDLYF